MFIHSRNGTWINLAFVKRVEWRAGPAPAKRGSGCWIAVDVDDREYRLYQDGGALERLLATTVVPAAPDQTVLDVYVDGDGTITEALPIVAWAVDAAYARPITAGNDDSCSNRHRFIALPDGRFLEAVFDGMTFDSRDAAVEYATKQHADAIAAAMVAAERDRAAAA
jgi:hypothetical protein